MWTLYRPGKGATHVLTNEQERTLNCFAPHPRILLFATRWFFTSWGLICHVVISSVRVWSRDARKHTFPEVCIPTATCNFSQRGHKSSPKSRMTTQSQEHDTTSKLFSCLFDLVAHWTSAEHPAWGTFFWFTVPWHDLHNTERNFVDCVKQVVLTLQRLAIAKPQRHQSYAPC